MSSARTSRRRIAVAVVGVIAIVAVFAVRLVDLQVVHAEELNTASAGKRAVSQTTYAARGDIVDMNGTVLAGSVMRYDITAAPDSIAIWLEQADDKTVVAQAATELSKILGVSASDILTTLTEDPTSNFTYVARKVSVEQLREVRALQIPGVYDENSPTRIYPDGAVAGNLVGFVGTDGPLNGLETTEESCLASTNGSSTYERSADNVRIPGSTVTSVEAIEGGTVHTSIDADLSWAVQQMIAEQAQAIGAVSATASVVEVKTGKIRVMADYPAVDPNDVNATAEVDVESLGSRAFTTAYEPGSTFKPMTAAILLEQNAVTPLTQVTVPSRWTTPEGGVINDAAPHAVQQLTLAGVIQNSSNVGISQLATRVPSGVRYDYMKAFGIGERTAVDFQGETTGQLSASWDDQTKYNVAFGQGVSVSAAQLASIYQTLGNGGVKLPLSMVDGCEAPDGTVTEDTTSEGTRVVSEASADTVLQMMESVVTGGGLSKQLTIPGYRIAAKSGTAEVAENGVYTNQRIVSLAGMAPAEDPQYSVIVTFTKPTTIKTSAAAAPTFTKIMTQVLKTYRVTPSTDPAPQIPTTW